MIRNVLAVVLGFISGNVLLWISRNINAKIYPLPENIDTSSLNAIKEFHAALPTSAFILETTSFLLAIFTAAFITARLCKSQHFNLGVFSGFIFMLVMLTLLFSFPNPIWVYLVDILGSFLAVYLGARLGAGGVPDYDL